MHVRLSYGLGFFVEPIISSLNGAGAVSAFGIVPVWIRLLCEEGGSRVGGAGVVRNDENSRG
jgi:hypothetical protein